MWKRVSSAVKTSKQSVLKAKQLKKDGWHSVTVKQNCSVKKKKGLFKCLVKGCKVWRKSKFLLRCHIKNEHPDFRWKCRVCTRSYATHEGQYKHELKHKYSFRFDCKTCHYRCMFEGEMEEHVKKHDRKQMWKCQKTGCDKRYPAKHSCNYHEKSHTAKDWHCVATNNDGKLCGQECVSKNHLKQHIRGFHGPGWLSRCGKHFNWLSSKYSHEWEYTKCQRVKRKEFKKPHLK